MQSVNVLRATLLTVSVLSPTWNDKIAALSVQGHLPELSRPLGMKVVPDSVVYPDLRDSDLEVACAHVEVEVEVAGEELQSKEMSALKVL